MAHSISRAVLAALVCIFTSLTGCAKDIPVFLPPDQRAVQNNEMPWPKNQYLALAYHDVEDGEADQSYVGVRTEHLKEQLAWLHANGFQAVSVDQILAAHQGGAPLPEKAVLLSFDDGYQSFYTHVFPILKAYGWPSILAPVGIWLDTPRSQKVDFGGLPTERDRFLYWKQVAELSRSGLVEVGAHTDNLHFGAIANPQGNQQPAAASRLYDPKTGQYETEASYKARLSKDVQEITRKIRQTTGKAPRVWVWPYGAASGTALKIVADNGYEMAMTLVDGGATVDDLMDTPRLLLANDPSLRNFSNAISGMQRDPTMRVAHVDLDYVYDPDPEQMERNLDKVIQRIADMQITTVFLQAFADPEGDGLARSVYFPNRHLPMRADLFNRAAWQLINRTHVDVYAWMPVLSFDLDPALPRIERWDPETGRIAPAQGQYLRLSPFDPKVRQQITEIYEDLSRHAIFNGVLYHDDALMSDFEDASPPALAAYQAQGLPGSIQQLRADPETMKKWTRYKSRYLVEFTQALTQRVREIRGPQIKTARNIYAMPILEPDSEAWFAQNMDDFLAAYDWTAPMAMPYMENVPHDQADAWLDRLVDAVAKRPGALKKTVFEVQARDWRTDTAKSDPDHIDSHTIARWMKRLQLRGARNFGYYPDDFIQDEPRLEIIRPALSHAWYPY